MTSVAGLDQQLAASMSALGLTGRTGLASSSSGSEGGTRTPLTESTRPSSPDGSEMVPSCNLIPEPEAGNRAGPW